MQTNNLRLVKLKIRRAIKALLVNKTKAGCNVFVSRTTNIDHEELPAIIIYPNTERVDEFNSAPKNYKRTFACKIEIIGADSADHELDELLETIAEQVELILEENETENSAFGKLINNLRITGSNYTFSGEGQTPVGSLILDVDFVYYADAIPEGLNNLPDFKGADVNWKHGHHNASPDTGDNLDVDGDGDDGSVKAQTKIDLPTGV